MAQVEALGWTPVKGTRWLETGLLVTTEHGAVGDRLWSPVTRSADGELRAVRAPQVPELASVTVLAGELPTLGEHQAMPGDEHEVTYYDRRFKCSIHGGPVALRLSQAAGSPLLLARVSGRTGFIWSSPLSILLRSELDELGLPDDLPRYRANIVLDDRDAPLKPQTGDWLQVGDLQLEVERELDRCQLVNHSPVTGERDEDLLGRLRPGLLLGYGCRVRTPGLLRTGQPANIL
ncbi:MOSC domain-containing protein [Luteococcus sp. Sow4_B9]|uniref:MOSC domain-containing protein n=1 Tax=Luteococcus sp. Sow4_B9 TaxID=3438792 RepID=UPI003F9B4017